MTPLSDCSDEELLAAAIQQYFHAEELAEAHRMVEADRSYEDAIAFLVKSAEADLRNSGEKVPPHWLLTVPGGQVFIYRPGHCFPERPVYEFHVGYLATLAFPATQKPEQPTPPSRPVGRQLSFWDESELTFHAQSQEEVCSKKTRTRKMVYLEQSIRSVHRAPQQGWVVKDAGLGYIVEPMRVGEGYLVVIVHLKSGREMASVVIEAVNHERIREWVSACVPLTDWNRGIQALLKDVQGKQKQLAWSQQLEAIWWQQKRVKRQVPFF
jgi:hypothetical protein